MKSIVILYMPGCAGNFLTRLVSLSPETIPQIPIADLKQLVRKNILPAPVNNRAEYYSFSQVPSQYTSWQDFHRDWPDFLNHREFETYNATFPTPFSHVVYSIHPHEFTAMEKEINQFDNDFYCIDLDDKFLPWLMANKQRLKFEFRPTYEAELAEFTALKTKYMMKSISLSNMLESTDSFLSEYLNTISAMQLTADVVAAQTLYQSWVKIRGLQ